MWTIENSEEFRCKFVSIINKKVNDNKLSKNLEIGIFNYTINECTNNKIVKKWDNPLFIQVYVDRARSVFNNLSENIIENFQSKELLPQDFSQMTHQEMNNDKWHNIIETKKKRDKSKIEERMIEGAFKCRKCGSEKTTYYQLQTRSADEPMTTYVQCECGCRWRC